MPLLIQILGIVDCTKLFTLDITHGLDKIILDGPKGLGIFRLEMVISILTSSIKLLGFIITRVESLLLLIVMV